MNPCYKVINEWTQLSYWKMILTPRLDSDLTFLGRWIPLRWSLRFWLWLVWFFDLAMFQGLKRKLHTEFKTRAKLFLKLGFSYPNPLISKYQYGSTAFLQTYQSQPKPNFLNLGTTLLGEWVIFKTSH